MSEIFLSGSQVEYMLGDGPKAECPSSTIPSQCFRAKAPTEQAHVGQGMELLRSDQEQMARGLRSLANLVGN